MTTWFTILVWVWGIALSLLAALAGDELLIERRKYRDLNKKRTTPPPG